MASSVMSSLDCIWKERRLPLSIKICVYLALVQSVLLYASETWTLTSADAKFLEAFHMKCQRRILSISWRQFVRNSEISALTGLPAITTSSDIDRWQYINTVIQKGFEDNDTHPFWKFVKAQRHDNFGIPPLKHHGVLHTDS